MLLETRILIVEDDVMTAVWIADFLEACSFVVEHASSVTEGIDRIRKNEYDLLLLDLNLTDFDGFEMLKSLRSFAALPVIVVSAYSDTQTKVKAFKYGASDYMVKPVNLEELEARIWAITGRYDKIRLEAEKSIFKIRQELIYFNGEALHLTALESELLSILIRGKNQTISRERLAESLSGISSHRSLDQHIKNIRKKIGDNGSNPRYLRTEYGAGYRLVF